MGVTKVTWVVRAWDDDELATDAHVDLEWANGPRGNRQVEDDDQRNCGDALIKDTSDACFVGSRVRVLRHRHGDS